MEELPIPFEEIENKVCEKWLFHQKCSDCLFMVLCNLEHEEKRYKRKMEERKNKK